jgi:hypothetical protein
MRARLSATLLVAITSCASAQTFHGGPSSLSPQERPLLVALKPKRDAVMERFWKRDGLNIGLIKWSQDGSAAAPEAPAPLLELVRDELGRVNKDARVGEQVQLAVNIFAWRHRWFGRAPVVQYEVVGRDRAGQLLWVGQDTVQVPRGSAKSLAETDEQVTAREIARRIRKELSL